MSDKPVEPWMNELQFKLAMLDAALTGKEWRTVSNTARTGSDLEFIFRDAYYLSDGGYSRVCIRFNNDETDMTVFMSSVSRPEVFERWKFCKELIEDVKQAAIKEAKKLGWYG